jgi:zinc protease
MNHKKFIHIFSILLLAALFTGQIFAQHPRDLKNPAPIKFKPIKPAEFTLTNGIKVFYLEDKELPLIALGGLLRTGSLYEPADKTGLASLTGSILRTGGTKKMTGDKIDEELEFLSANSEYFI